MYVGRTCMGTFKCFQVLLYLRPICTNLQLICNACNTLSTHKNLKINYHVYRTSGVLRIFQVVKEYQKIVRPIRMLHV